MADTIRGLHYSLRTGRVSPNYMVGSKIHELRVRIDGKFNEKPIKPLYFDGYIYYELRIYHFSAKETRNEEFVGTIHGSRPSPFMIFGIGDWTKDEEIRKALEYERIEGEKWIEENKKWVEENKKQIEKTTKAITGNTKKRKPPRRKVS